MANKEQDKKKKKKAKPKKYYAIKEGKNGVKNKIVRTWAECQKIVLGYPSVYKSFLTEEEALKYLDTVEVKKVQEQMKKGIEAKKQIKATTKALHMRLDKELMESFEAKCKQLELTPEQAIKGMIEEWIY